MASKKTALIVGAGPAGLTAAYELLTRSDDYEVIILEEREDVGGISRTVTHNGNRMDMGGHRFFSKVAAINDWWHSMLPLQGAPAIDDIILDREVPLVPGGPDPEKTDEVMLTRHRVSRIFFNGKYYDYPISVKPETFINLGFRNSLAVALSYLASVIHKRPEDNLENFYINRFGLILYQLFFEDYTENLWGRHPSEIDASWGAQRTKGLSIASVLKDVIERTFNIQRTKVETSLIESFTYPKLGPGQLWEVVAAKVEELGGKVIHGSVVTGVELNDDANAVVSVTALEDGKQVTRPVDLVISSMPLKDLVLAMGEKVPPAPHEIAEGLPYRDYQTLGVLVSKTNLENKTDIPAIGTLVPDEWVYVQDRTVKMGRFQIFNNWSPYLVKDLMNTVWIGLEYFCDEGDELWTMTDEEFKAMALDELVTIGVIDSPDVVLDTHREFVKKAYPAYFDTYDRIDELVAWMNTLENVYCVGRNGQHRYNNIDHSMMTAMEAVTNIVTGRADRAPIWNVNTESDYQEAGNDPSMVDSQG